MQLEVDRLSPEDWRPLSENAHLIAFGKHKPSDWDRIDFALIVKNDLQPMGYLTCREFDHETLYWQFGGAFPGTKDTVLTWHGYQAFAAWCKPKYKRVTTLIENSNVVMLKMAMKLGFRIIGVRCARGTILLEHVLEFNE